MVFSLNDSENSINGFFQVGIAVEHDIIKLIYPLQLLASGLDALAKFFGGFGFTVLEALDQFGFILSG